MQTTTRRSQEIYDALNAWVPKELVRLDSDNAVFALDADVDYTGRTLRIDETRVLSQSQFEDTLARLFAVGPEWVHANLIPTSDGRFLVAVSAGAGVGHSRPTLNLSHELDKIVQIDKHQS